MSLAALQFGLSEQVHGSAGGGLSVDRRGGLDVVDEHAAIRQSIVMILLTRRGERVMRPDFGSDLHDIVFSPMDRTSAGLAMHLARQAVSRWEPRVKLLRCDAEFEPSAPDGSVLRIRLEYEIRGGDERGRSEVELTV